MHNVTTELNIETTPDTTTLPEQAINEAGAIASDVIALFRSEESVTRQRANLIFRIWNFIFDNGLTNVRAHAEQNGYSTTSKVFIYHVAVQFAMGVNIFKDTDEEEKKARMAKVRPFMRCIDYMFRQNDAERFDAMDEDAFYAYYIQIGQQSGMGACLDKLTRKAEPEMAAPAEAANAIIEKAFASPTIATLPSDFSVPHLAPGQTIMCVIRDDGDGVKLLPLPKAHPAVIADMTGYSSFGMEDASTTAIFWHEVMTVAPAIIPDIARSNEPVEPLAPGDEPNAATDMLPANAVYMLRDAMLTVANARLDDTRILTIAPRDGVETFAVSQTPRFMDKRGRDKMAARLAKPSVCAGYSEHISAETRDDRLRIVFKHGADKALNGQLLFPPMTAFNTNWTHRVSPAFKAAVSASLDASAVESLEAWHVTVLWKNRNRKDAPVTVTIGDNAISLQWDKGKAERFEASTNGATKVRVMASDLLATLPNLLKLDRDGDLVFEVDPNGMLVVEVKSAVATYRAHLQALERGRDTRSRKLLERVGAAPKPVNEDAAELPSAGQLAA